jgi:hypothetical protein
MSSMLFKKSGEGGKSDLSRISWRGVFSKVYGPLKVGDLGILTSRPDC